METGKEIGTAGYGARVGKEAVRIWKPLKFKHAISWPWRRIERGDEG